MASTNDEAFQLLGLLLGILLPDLEAINLTPVMIKLPIDLLQISPHHFASCLHQRDQLLDLHGEGSKLGPISLRLVVELMKLFIPLIKMNVHEFLDLQLDPHHSLYTISLQRRC